jgi:hypothetical protein
MPEVKASPATPDKSLSHSRYSLATHRDWKIFAWGYIRQGPLCRLVHAGYFLSLQDALSKQEEL